MGSKLVIGQYYCGCTYGPVQKKNRYAHCNLHGADIQCEYVAPDNWGEEAPTQDRQQEWLANQQKEHQGYIKCSKCDEFQMAYDPITGIWQCLACSNREDLG